MPIPNDQAAGMDEGCLFIFGIYAGISDMRISQRYQLLAIGWISQDFLISGHRGVENHFAGGNTINAY